MKCDKMVLSCFLCCSVLSIRSGDSLSSNSIEYLKMSLKIICWNLGPFPLLDADWLFSQNHQDISLKKRQETGSAGCSGQPRFKRLRDKLM